MSGTSFYLFIAAVNYDQSIFDTDVLSVIRGASRAALEAPSILVDEIYKTCSNNAKITPIAIGGSEGFSSLNICLVT